MGNIEDVAKSLAEFEEKIRPAVLQDSLANRDLFVGWCRKNRITKPTVGNLIQCVKDLRDHLEWKVAPRKKGDVEQSGGAPGQRRSHTEPEDNTVSETSVRKAARKIDGEKAKVILRECKSLVDSHSSYPHSKAFRERAALLERYNRLVANSPSPINQKQAEAIRAELNNLQNSFE